MNFNLQYNDLLCFVNQVIIIYSAHSNPLDGRKMSKMVEEYAFKLYNKENSDINQFMPLMGVYYNKNIPNSHKNYLYLNHPFNRKAMHFLI